MDRIPASMEVSRTQAIRTRLIELDEERQRLESELRTLEDSICGTLPLTPLASIPGIPALPAEKVALFLSLFGARRSVFPKFWENPKTGKKGYSPACANEWQRPLCAKPKIKCSDCRHQKFPPLDAAAVEAHLRATAPPLWYSCTAPCSSINGARRPCISSS